MSKSKQIRLHVDALPLLDDLQALLVERSYAPVSRSWTLRVRRHSGRSGTSAPPAPRGRQSLGRVAGKATRLEHDNTDAVKA